ncbi:MAG: dGTP triphosphohydrolase, partial [Candidatus Cloacimonetes bacterium]|nr:dGTP triphosphohydrolase [Candidatus Cloacimonadota bacterium]
EEIPKECVDFLGNNNSQIIDTLVKSIIINSFEKPYIRFDTDTSEHLKKLKDFNYQRIYLNDEIKKANRVIKKSMELLFEKYLEDIKSQDDNSKIFKHFLANKNQKYLDTYSDAEKVRDFIATMTDRYFNEEVKDYLLPWKL